MGLMQRAVDMCLDIKVGFGRLPIVRCFRHTTCCPIVGRVLHKDRPAVGVKAKLPFNPKTGTMHHEGKLVAIYHFDTQEVEYVKNRA